MNFVMKVNLVNLIFWNEAFVLKRLKIEIKFEELNLLFNDLLD